MAYTPNPEVLDFSRMDFSQPEVTRRAVVALGEHQRRASLDAATREGEVLSALGRIERTTALTHAAIEGVSVRVSRLESRAPTDAELDRVKAEMRVIRERNVELDKREAVSRARLTSQVDALEKRLGDAEDDLSQTGQRYIADVMARARALDAEVKAKSSELEKAKDEEAKEGRESKRYWLRWIAGIVSAVVLMVVSAWAGANWAKPAPTPAGILPSATPPR